MQNKNEDTNFTDNWKKACSDALEEMATASYDMETKEIEKNARVLNQACRSQTSFFPMLPQETLVAIISMMGRNPDVIEYDKYALELAFKYFTNDNLESKIRFMLGANTTAPDRQYMLDQRFSELCAEKFLIPVINNVQVNEDTLIALAHHTASVNLQNDMLQRQNQELVATIAKLRSDLSTTPGTFFNAQTSNKEQEKTISAGPMNP